jgi:hypothetical protein
MIQTEQTRTDAHHEPVGSSLLRRLREVGLSHLLGVAGSPWFRNELKRLIKTPKLPFVDSGLLAALLALTTEQIAKNRSDLAPSLRHLYFPRS